MLPMYSSYVSNNLNPSCANFQPFFWQIKMLDNGEHLVHTADDYCGRWSGHEQRMGEWREIVNMRNTRSVKIANTGNLRKY